jgi:hypothetical protein
MAPEPCECWSFPGLAQRLCFRLFRPAHRCAPTIRTTFHVPQRHNPPIADYAPTRLLVFLFHGRLFSSLLTHHNPHSGEIQDCRNCRIGREGLQAVRKFSRGSTRRGRRQAGGESSRYASDCDSAQATQFTCEDRLTCASVLEEQWRTSCLPPFAAK